MKPDDWVREMVVGQVGVYVIPAELGRVSWFGGVADLWMGESEPVSLVPGLLGKALDPTQFYCAMRWRLRPLHLVVDKWVWSTMSIYAATLDFARVVACRPVDWGPNEKTGRVCDLSPAAMACLGLTTDREARFGLSARRSAYGVVRG